MIVTIDGPAGCGKSSLAQRIAEDLGWTFVDTGAMYRAVAWQADRSGINTKDGNSLGRMCRSMDLDLRWTGGDLRVVVDGCDVTEALRDERISTLASAIATVAQVRSALVDKQRALAGRFANIVTEGRDQGSVVFPEADVKIFLDATVEERARRRCAQLAEQGRPGDYDRILADMADRDRQDQTRSTAPLVVPQGASRIDTTDLTLEQVVQQVKALIDRRRGG